MAGPRCTIDEEDDELFLYGKGDEMAYV